MPLTKIKLFNASSSELKEDREEFRIFIGLENERLIDKNIFLQIVQWEYFLDAISDTRLQNEYNKAIRECDIVVCLFFTKVGKYTAEEFDTAYQVFKETGKPRIWTYFKDAPVNAGLITEEIQTLLAFKKKLSDLGHFHTVYTNIDNLKYKFRNQLDKILPELIIQNEEPQPGNKQINVEESGRNTFNEILTRRLIQAIQEFNPRAKKFLENASRMKPDWEVEARFCDPAKEIIASCFVGILGIQLRKLMAIGKEKISENKIRKYLEISQLTCKRGLQLLCFALISKLWDYKKDKNYTLTSLQTTTLKNFFEDEFELNIMNFTNLLKTLVEVFNTNNIDFPILEINESSLNFDAQSDFMIACNQLQSIDKLLDTSSYSLSDCIETEKNLATVLETMKFFANYKMVSIKSIGYFEMHNSRPYYLYNYTSLGIDSKFNFSQERITYADNPANTDAVLLYKGTSYKQSLNLFPFIIDVNALAFEGGAKICFYGCHDSSDGSLNYNFLEDNSIVNIANTQTLKPGMDINELLLDPKNRKAMKFDAVYNLFQEAKKAVTGTEEEDFLNTL